MKDLEIICKNCDECLSISRSKGSNIFYSACFYRTPFDKKSQIDNLPGLHSLPIPSVCEGFTPKKTINTLIDEVLKDEK